MRTMLGSVGAVLLLVPLCAGGRYKAVRLTTTKVREDQNMVQLAELQLCAKGTIYKPTPDAAGEVTCDEVVDYTLPAFAVSSSESTHAPNKDEEPAKAADGDITTKWLDDSMPPPSSGQSGATVLTLTFGATQEDLIDAIAFRFVTADDEPGRDPVAWRLDGTVGGRGVMWTYNKIHECTDCAAEVPTARKEKSAWFAFPEIPPGPKRATPDDLDIQGCSGGCAFLIIFFCGGFTYFIAGAAINYKRYEKRGIDVIPHAAFWQDLPLLVKDGVRFAHRKVRGGDGGGNYSTV